jgi:hypothetical protein
MRPVYSIDKDSIRRGVRLDPNTGIITFPTLEPSDFYKVSLNKEGVAKPAVFYFTVIARKQKKKKKKKCKLLSVNQFKVTRT